MGNLPLAKYKSTNAKIDPFLNDYILRCDAIYYY